MVIMDRNAPFFIMIMQIGIVVRIRPPAPRFSIFPFQLFEMLILECFQAGLSWECVLNKREAFRKAFDGFDLEK